MAKSTIRRGRPVRLHFSRVGVSAAVAAIIIIAVAAGAAGTFFVLSGTPGQPSAAQSTSTLTETTSTQSISSTTTSSTLPTHSTSSHNGTETVSATNTVSTSTTNTGHPTPILVTVFGTSPNGNISTPVETIPANTLVWTNYVMNSSTFVSGVGTEFENYPYNYNTSISMAVYVNGVLTSQNTHLIIPATPPPDHPNATLPIPTTQADVVVVNSTLPAGSTVSLAILCATPLTDSSKLMVLLMGPTPTRLHLSRIRCQRAAIPHCPTIQA